MRCRGRGFPRLGKCETKRAWLAFAICLAALAPAAAGDGTIINAHDEARFGKPIAFRKMSETAGTMALEISGRKLYALEDHGLSVFDISVLGKPHAMQRGNPQPARGALW